MAKIGNQGTPSGIYLGGSLLTPELLASGCSSLHPDGQVNIVVPQAAFYERSKRLGGERLTSTHRQQKMSKVTLNRGPSPADSEIRSLVRHL